MRSCREHCSSAVAGKTDYIVALIKELTKPDG
jgi:hypothetical protein